MNGSWEHHWQESNYIDLIYDNKHDFIIVDDLLLITLKPNGKGWAKAMYES